MEWSESISEAINYIESHITEELTIADIAKQAIISPYYFQKGFSMLCGFTVGEYIKRRRLTLAGSEIVSTDRKIIDIALEYGYDSPDSFTKAFLRFHGVTPTAIRKGEAMIKSFAPLKIKLVLTGGYTMDYKIVQKAPFTVVGVSATFRYETADNEIPKFWEQFNQSGKNTLIASMYGVSIDKDMDGNEFEYLIADNYNLLHILFPNIHGLSFHAEVRLWILVLCRIFTKKFLQSGCPKTGTMRLQPGITSKCIVTLSTMQKV